MVQLIEGALKAAAQVIRPVQVDHHLEPDAMRGSEEFLTGRYAPRDADGNLHPIFNAEAARVDTLRSQMLSTDPIEVQDPTAGSVVGHVLPDSAMTGADGGPRRVSEVPAPSTDANGKPLLQPGAVDPSWMAQAKAAGWEPTEPAWMREARAQGWNPTTGQRSDAAQPQPGSTGRVPDYSRLSASTDAPSVVPMGPGAPTAPVTGPGSEPPTSAATANAESAGMGSASAGDQGTSQPARTPA